MAHHYKTLNFNSHGQQDVFDLTDSIQEEIQSSSIREGVVLVFVPGSTAGISTIEYEPGAVSDLKNVWDTIVPEKKNYKHNLRWGDGNGHSHIRSTLQGTSLSIPVHKGSAVLGTWQQVILVDFDNKPRNREVVIQIIGDV